jgi:predicted transcriptional regulator
VDNKKNDARAEELVRLFVANGVNKHVARILALFEEHAELTSWDIQSMLRMQQPLVSEALQAMRENGWVVSQTVPIQGKGRPYNVYSLARPFREIVQEIVNARALELKTLENKMLDLMGAIA